MTNSGSLDGTTDYYYDGEQEIEEHNGAGTLTQQYVYGSGIDEAAGHGPQPDRRQPPRPPPAISGCSTTRMRSARSSPDGHLGQESWRRYQYDAYGRQTVFDPGPAGVVVFGSGDVVTPGGASDIGNPFLFTGQRLDPEDGLYYYRARLYDPTQGRFIQRDSYPVEGVGNAYEYALDNPINAFDPSGHAPEPMLGPDPELLFAAILASYKMGVQAERDFFRRVAVANAQIALAAYRKWLCGLCSENKAIVKHYVEFFHRLPTANELNTTDPACKNDKPFVKPADRYVVKSRGAFWFAVNTKTNRIVVITDTQKNAFMVKGRVEHEVAITDTGQTFQPK